MESSSHLIYFLIFLISMVSSSFLVPLLRKIAIKFSILDRPNQAHKSHSESVPYLGGLSIIIPICLFAIIGPSILVESSDYRVRTLLLLVPAVLLALVGLYDDINNSSAFSRFLFQSVLSGSSCIYLNELGYSVSITNSKEVNFLISVIWLVGIINAFNFFDNLDGGAAGITFVSATSLFILSIMANQYFISAFALALAGSSLGFLWWNKAPAKIYLGDAGSLFIGYLIGISILQFEPSVESKYASVLIPVFLLALPIIDTTVAVLSRISRGVSIFLGGQDHLSHRLIAIGLTKSQAAYWLWFVACIFSSLSFLVTQVSKSVETTLSTLSLLFMGFLIVWFLSIDANRKE